jgi:two-component system chemotaxis response regulator CheB
MRSKILFEHGRPAFVGIGASAGGVSAVRALIMKLPRRLPMIPIAVVQHLPPQARLDVGLVYGSHGGVRIIEVEDKMPIQPGCVYMAAPGYHLLIERDRTFALSQDEPVLHSRPSIDVFFESIAEVYGSASIGILLTGANADGARGLKRIGDAGGVTIVQDPGEAESDTMPRSAIELQPPQKIMGIAEISEFINSLGQLPLETLS